MKTHHASFFVSLALLGCIAACPVATADEPLRLQQARFGHAAVAVGDAIYIFGGTSNDEIIPQIERISPDRTSVDAIGAMPHPRYWLNAVTDGTYVYLVGGTTFGETRPEPSDMVERWDPVTDTWTTLAPLPQARAHVGVVWHQDRLYAIGGNTKAEGRTGRVDIYDPATDTWTSSSPMPTARECDVVAYRGKFHAIGGYDGKNSLAIHEVYDPVADQWERAADLPFVLSAHHMAVVNDTLYTFGHYAQPDRVGALDFTTGEWTLLDIDYQASRHNDVVFDGKEVWVIGGNDKPSPPYFDYLQRFDSEQLKQAPRRSAGDDEAIEIEKSKPFYLSPATEAALGTWARLLSQIDTLSVEWKQTYERPDYGVMGDPQVSSVHIDKKQQKLRSTANQLDWIMDGSDVVLINSTRKRFMKTAQTNSLAELKNVNAAGYGLPSVDIMAMLDPDPMEFLRQRAIQHKWELLPPPPHVPEGSLYFIASLPTSTHVVMHQERFAVNSTNGIIFTKRTEYQHAHLRDGEIKTNTTMMGMETLSTIINQPLPENAFSYRLEDSWKKLDTLEAFYAQPDRSRFALSGKPAPNFTLSLLDGSTFTLSDHTGKVVVIDFWATWCGPCVKALPHMQTFHDAMKTQDVIVVGISSDDPDSERDVRKMIQDKGITYAIGIDTNEIDEAYFVTGIPCVVLVNQAGIVQGRKVGFSPSLADTLQKQVEILLAGGTLPSAEPMTEADEEEAPRRSFQETRLDPRFFEALWETNQPSAGERRSPIFFFSPASIMMPPSLLIWHDNQRIIGRDPVTGEELISALLPTSSVPAEADISYRDLWTLLRRPDATPLLVRHRQTLQSEKNESGRRSSRVINNQIAAFHSNGETVWDKKSELSNFSSMAPLAIGKDKDLLLLAGYSQFVLMDDQGVVLVNQSIQMPDTVQIYDTDGDGIPEFYLNGTRSGLYRLRK